MTGNIDGALKSLADEINAVNAQDQVEHRSKQIAMGHKLIAVRVILREQFGTAHNCPLGADGKKAPIGWGKWVGANLTVSFYGACRCIKLAVDPSRLAVSNKREFNRSIDGRRALTVLRQWPSFTDDNKRKIAEFVFARWQEERTSA